MKYGLLYNNKSLEANVSISNNKSRSNVLSARDSTADALLSTWQTSERVVGWLDICVVSK